MNNSEKKVLSVIALIIVLCLAAVTAVSLLHKPIGNADTLNTSASVSIEDKSSNGDSTVQTNSATAESNTAVSDVNTTAFETTSASQQNIQITLEEAKSIALKDSNKEENAVTFTKQKLDKEKGITEYDIEFHDGVTEWEYEINAQTGAIISFSSESYDYD